MLPFVLTRDDQGRHGPRSVEKPVTADERLRLYAERGRRGAAITSQAARRAWGDSAGVRAELRVLAAETAHDLVLEVRQANAWARGRVRLWGPHAVAFLSSCREGARALQSVL